MSKYVYGINFITEECCNCGMPFAMTAEFQQRRLNDHKLFYCPAGHSQHYTGKTEAQKLREQLDKAKRDLEAESGRAAMLARERDQVAKSYTRIRDRVKNGVCPCCNRTFQNLMQHMKTEHPEFGSHETLRAMRDAFGLTQSALADEIDVPAQYVSSYENKRYLPGWAKTAIDTWLESHA